MLADLRNDTQWNSRVSRAELQSVSGQTVAGEALVQPAQCSTPAPCLSSWLTLPQTAFCYLWRKETCLRPVLRKREGSGCLGAAATSPAPLSARLKSNTAGAARRIWGKRSIGRSSIRGVHSPDHRRRAAAPRTREKEEMILATTQVEDFDRFLNTFSTKGAEKRKQHGSKGSHVFRDPNEDDRVWVLFDWDAEGWQSFVSDPEVPPIMQEAGHKGKPQPAEFGGQHDA